MVGTEQDALAFLKALSQRKAQRSFVDESFPEQAAFIRDDSPLVAALCSRRAGKSFGVGLKMFRAAMAEPGSSVLYLALTRMTAKRIMWKDILQPIAKRFDIPFKPNETELSMTLPNGSVIYLAGADTAKHEMEKVLGGKLKLAVVDESGSFRQDLRKIAYENLEPALADYDGTLAMIGTPTDLIKSFFAEVTLGTHTERSWKIHRWNTTQNPYLAAKWRKRIEEMVLGNPRIVETPFFKRMYLGEWVMETDALVYRFSEERNTIDALPEGRYTYVLGVDLGYNDDSAFSLGAFSQSSSSLFVAESYKRPKMIVSDVAERIRYYQKKYDIYRIVIDNASKQAVEELKQRYMIQGIVAADKKNKAEFIEIMNADFENGKIKLTQGQNDGLMEEYGQLIWDDRSQKREEHPSCPNHLADATLYMWRECYNYLYRPEVKTFKTEEEILEERIEEAFTRQQAKDSWLTEELNDGRFELPEGDPFGFEAEWGGSL